MAYTKTTWNNNASPSISADKLNNIEEGISNAHSDISSNLSDINTNKSNIATNAANIATNTAGIASNDSDIASLDSRVSANTSNISTNTTNIAKNTDDIATLISGETPQGAWTPVDGAEYPVSYQNGWSWYISGVSENGYTFTGGYLTGKNTQNMDKLIRISTGWSLIENDLTLSVPNGGTGASSLGDGYVLF